VVSAVGVAVGVAVGCAASGVLAVGVEGGGVAEAFGDAVGLAAGLVVETAAFGATVAFGVGVALAEGSGVFSVGSVISGSAWAETVNEIPVMAKADPTRTIPSLIPSRRIRYPYLSILRKF